MKKTILLFLLFTYCVHILQAQIVVGQDTLYGNEWLDYSKSYYKIRVNEDGVYRIGYDVLISAGIQAGSISGSDWRLYRNGQQTPIFTSTNGSFTTTDFIEFWGEKNRSEVDRHLFENPNEDIVNPWYSLYSDTTAYFLVQETNTTAVRYSNLANNLSNLPAPEAYCWRTSLNLFTNVFTKREISSNVTYSWYNGDGFSSPSVVNSDFTFTPVELYSSGPTEVSCRIRYGANQNLHYLQLLLNGTEFALDSFNGWKIIDRTFQVPISALSPTLNIKLNGLAGPIDRNFLSGYEVRYPGTFNFPGNLARFSIESSTQDKYLEINNFNTSGGNPILYDLANRARLVCTIQNGLVQARLTASNTERQLVLVAPGQGIKAITSIKSVQFRNYAQEQAADLIIISNPKLYKDPLNNGANHVADYANYRSSFVGGSHQVAIVDVNELYEQFGFGVFSHPLAIQNFTHYIKREWPIANSLMMIGKGLDYNSLRQFNTLSTLADSLHYVPMFGYPSVDLCYLMPHGKVAKPILSVGRIAVTKPVEIKYYLDKVKDFESGRQQSGQTLAERAWMKRVIHASGGTPNESATIRYYSDDIGSVLQNNRFGADIRKFSKKSTDPVQTSAFDELKSTVDDGVALWMVFGHSGPNIVDFDIGEPGNYQNRPKYPYLMILGCFTGTCSLPTKGLGEDYILTPNRGSIAYSAAINYGFIHALYNYSKTYYAQLGGSSYGKSIGAATQATVEALQNDVDPAVIALLQQYTLQGDPNINITPAIGPDYVLDPPTVTFDPNPIPTDAPNYDLSFDVVNIGENVPTQMTVRVEEKQADNTLKTILRDTIDAPGLRSTLKYTLPSVDAATGYHKYFLTVDSDNSVTETPAAAELNNKLISSNGEEGTEVYFYSNDIQPVFPPEYAIVGKQNISLYGSVNVGQSNAISTRYLFELDTLESFNSPFKKSKVFVQSGGLMEWKLDLGVADSTVLYWRVARDSSVNGRIPWKSSSFVYLQGSKSGWNQSDYGQYKMNLRENISANDATRKIVFSDNSNYLLVRLSYRDGGTFPGFLNSFGEGLLTNFQLSFIHGFSKGIGLMVHNPATGRVILNPAGGPHNPVPNNFAKFFFHFDPTDSLQRIGLMEFIKNDIPDNAVVGVLMGNASSDQLGIAPELWANDSITYGKNLFQTFEELGAKHIRRLANYPNVPPAYGMIFKKNNASFVPIDTILDTPGTDIEIRKNYEAPWYTGKMESRKIGPTKAWNSLHYHPAPEIDPRNETSLTVYGLRQNEPDTVLMTLTAPSDTAINWIDAKIFPHLRLSYHLYDTVNHKTTPLDYIRVLYEPIPEGALHPLAKFEFRADTLERGDPMTARIAFANISNANFDTLTVKYRVENQAGNNQVIVQKVKPLAQGDTINAYVKIDTKTLNGDQRLLIDVNPDNDQPELTHSNNVAIQPFFVRKDDRNPLLNVTFDGTRLLDGDIISPKPEIVIAIKDDNKFLLMDDTSSFEIKVITPAGNSIKLPLNDPSIVFVPANIANLDKKNEARIEWRPYFEEDGTYELVIQGRDITGNASGSVAYSVTFRVFNKSSISNILNYPNPFSTSTCFYYTMTGLETPTQFKILIMTVSGKIVREVTEQEFGPLQAGTHQSQFCWNGKDEFGDQLANGVYLYKISARKADGTPFEFFETTAVDGFFKNGIGKMVLMR
jgi:hypothetical protein